MLIQYIEGDIDIVEKMKRTGKYEKCQMRYNIHMEDELNNSRLWLTRNYKEALYHRLDKDLQYDMDNDMDMELQRISLQYGMLNFIIYDNVYSRYFYSDQWGLYKLDNNLPDFIFDEVQFSIFRNNIFYNGKKCKTYIEYIDVFADDMVYYVIY